VNAEARVAGLRLTLVIVWMGMTLSACTSLGTRPDREQESAASTSKSTPENEADVASQGAYREYLTWIEVELVPRVESEVKEMMRRGWVRSVDDIDLWHLHIGYPSDLFPEGSAHVSIETLRSVHETAPHHLLYHSMERPHEVRRSWMNALAQAEHKELLPKLRNTNLTTVSSSFRPDATHVLRPLIPTRWLATPNCGRRRIVLRAHPRYNACASTATDSPLLSEVFSPDTSVPHENCFRLPQLCPAWWKPRLATNTN